MPSANNIKKNPADLLFLHPEELSFYQKHGYLVRENFITTFQCDMLMKRAAELINSFEPTEQKVIFSTTGQQHAKHQYFLYSGNHISFFFEEDSIDKEGNITTDKMKSINKIGHAMHDLDPVFNSFSRSHKIAALTQDLGINDPLLLQSMYICKQPYIGGEVTCHQDSTYLLTKNQPVTGFWFALQDATIENGCLWAMPGGHHEGLKSSMLRGTHDDISIKIDDQSPWNLDKMIPLEVKHGTVIVLHGHLPHMSKKNLSSKSRHAYTLHVISGSEPYSEKNWIRRDASLPLRGFL